MSRMKDLQKSLFGGTTSNARQFGMIFTLVAIVLLFQVLTDTSGVGIRGTNGLSNGIVPWLKTLDSSDSDSAATSSATDSASSVASTAAS